MTWQPVDCHAHSTLSDGALTVEQIAERGRWLGVRTSVSDHISRDIAVGPRDLAAIAAYLDEVERFPVLRGGEFCWHDALWRELPGDLIRRFTHRIGSLHGIFAGDGRLIHSFARLLPDGLTPTAYMDAYVDNLERLAAEMPVDILAHPTLLPLPFRDRSPEDMWSESHEERAVVALHRAAIALEVSARYRPHERLLRRAVAAGVRLSLGSDGHAADQVGNITWPLAMTRAIGVRDADLYDPTVHGSRTGCFDVLSPSE